MTRVRMTPDVAKKLSVAEQHHWFQQQRSRRAILKGGIAGAGSIVAGTTLLGRSAGASAVVTPPRNAQSPTSYFTSTPTNAPGVVPFGRHISFGSDPTQQMNIAWQVAAPVANPFVRIGTNPFDLGEQVPAALKNVSTPWADITHFLDSVPPASSSAQAPEEQHYAHAALSRLQPGTTYYYVVGHQGLDPASGSQSFGAMASFTTAPSRATPSLSPPSAIRASPTTRWPPAI
jgi:Purple acid Phosphatase, N-terminal domain